MLCKYFNYYHSVDSVFHQRLNHITLVFHHSTLSLPSQYIQSSTTVYSVWHHITLKSSIRSSITVYWNHQIHSVLQGTDENWQKVNRTVLTGVCIDRSLFLFVFFFLSFSERRCWLYPKCIPKVHSFLHSTLIPPVQYILFHSILTLPSHHTRLSQYTWQQYT